MTEFSNQTDQYQQHLAEYLQLHPEALDQASNPGLDYAAMSFDPAVGGVAYPPYGYPAPSPQPDINAAVEAALARDRAARESEARRKLEQENRDLKDAVNHPPHTGRNLCIATGVAVLAIGTVVAAVKYLPGKFTDNANAESVGSSSTVPTSTHHARRHKHVVAPIANTNTPTSIEAPSSSISISPSSSPSVSPSPSPSPTPSPKHYNRFKLKDVPGAEIANVKVPALRDYVMQKLTFVQDPTNTTYVLAASTKDFGGSVTGTGRISMDAIPASAFKYDPTCSGYNNNRPCYSLDPGSIRLHIDGTNFAIQSSANTNAKGIPYWMLSVAKVDPTSRHIFKNLLATWEKTNGHLKPTSFAASLVAQVNNQLAAQSRSTNQTDTSFSADEIAEVLRIIDGNPQYMSQLKAAVQSYLGNVLRNYALSEGAAPNAIVNINGLLVPNLANIYLSAPSNRKPANANFGLEKDITAVAKLSDPFQFVPLKHPQSLPHTPTSMPPIIPNTVSATPTHSSASPSPSSTNSRSTK